MLSSLLWLATPSAALATDAPLVVVLTGNRDVPFVRRLAAELSLFGYRVEIAERSGDDAELAEVLSRHGGAALIAVDQGRQTAEVVVAPRPGALESRRELERLDPRRPADTNAAVLAERFRAHLTELGISPGAVTVSPPPVPAAAPRRPPLPGLEPERRFWVGAGVGATSGGLGALPEASLELRAFPVRRLSASVFGKASLARAHVTAREGSADVRLWAAGLALDAYPVRGQLSIALGVAAMLLDAKMSGSAEPPWQGQDVSVLAPAALLQAGAAWRVTPRVSAEVRGFVGGCSPRISVRIAEQKAADFGQPLFGASAGLAFGVF